MLKLVNSEHYYDHVNIATSLKQNHSVFYCLLFVCYLAKRKIFLNDARN